MQKEEIKDLVIEKFSFMEDELGFLRPIVKDKDWSTEIYYLNNQIGVEFQLDWRDFDIFVLLVRLEDSKIPGGYYMNKGIRCRIHLEEVLKGKLKINDEILNGTNGKKRSNSKPSEELLKETLTKYYFILRKYVEKLIDAGETLFEV